MIDVSGKDAIVVGAGPNGLSAAIALGLEGFRVEVLEARPQAGGGVHTSNLTLPGFLHDPCSGVFPLARASPFFRSLPLAEHGLTFIEPAVELAHPFVDGTAALLFRSPEATSETLDPVDQSAWRALFRPWVSRFDELSRYLLGGLIRPPRHPVTALRFGLHAMRSAEGLANKVFLGPRAKALFAGIAAHAEQPLEGMGTASFGLFLGAAGHAVGWPIVRGGASRLIDALVSVLRSLGGELRTSLRVNDLNELPAVRAVLLDLSAREVIRVAKGRLPTGYLRRLRRFRYGPGAFRVDYALRAPIPWRARGCAEAGTVHLGGTLEEISFAERAVARGEPAERPFVLVGQTTPFDPSRAPPEKHVAWAYAHVPHGFSGSAKEALEDQIERFAPGFRDVVLARSVRGPTALEAENPNFVGGDLGSGANDLAQILFRPIVSLDPWRTPARGLWLCSASTPPGGGVHGMCGWNAARSVLRG